MYFKICTNTLNRAHIDQNMQIFEMRKIVALLSTIVEREDCKKDDLLETRHICFCSNKDHIVFLE